MHEDNDFLASMRTRIFTRIPMTNRRTKAPKKSSRTKKTRRKTKWHHQTKKSNQSSRLLVYV